MSQSQKLKEPEQQPINPAGASTLVEMKNKATALSALAEKAGDEVQLCLVRSLVANQIVHATSEIESGAHDLRSFDLGVHGDEARLKSLNHVTDLVTLLERLVELGAYITQQLSPDE
jgi:hypothetical protein